MRIIIKSRVSKEKIEERWTFQYYEPVTLICTPKEVICKILDETVKVNVACVDCPGASWVPCSFHVIVIGPLALEGLQFDVSRFRVSVDSP